MRAHYLVPGSSALLATTSPGAITTSQHGFAPCRVGRALDVLAADDDCDGLERVVEDEQVGPGACRERAATS